MKLGLDQQQMVLGFIKLTKVNCDVYSAVKIIQNQTSELQQKVVDLLAK
jgi:hypothetical protein